MIKTTSRTLTESKEVVSKSYVEISKLINLLQYKVDCIQAGIDGQRKFSVNDLNQFRKEMKTDITTTKNSLDQLLEEFNYCTGKLKLLIPNLSVDNYSQDISLIYFTEINDLFSNINSTYGQLIGKLNDADEKKKVNPNNYEKNIIAIKTKYIELLKLLSTGIDRNLKIYDNKRNTYLYQYHNFLSTIIKSRGRLSYTILVKHNYQKDIEPNEQKCVHVIDNHTLLICHQSIPNYNQYNLKDILYYKTNKQIDMNVRLQPLITSIKNENKCLLLSIGSVKSDINNILYGNKQYEGIISNIIRFLHDNIIESNISYKLLLSICEYNINKNTLFDYIHKTTSTNIYNLKTTEMKHQKDIIKKLVDYVQHYENNGIFIIKMQISSRGSLLGEFISVDISTKMSQIDSVLLNLYKITNGIYMRDNLLYDYISSIILDKTSYIHYLIPISPMLYDINITQSLLNFISKISNEESNDDIEIPNLELADHKDLRTELYLSLIENSKFKFNYLSTLRQTKVYEKYNNDLLNLDTELKSQIRSKKLELQKLENEINRRDELNNQLEQQVDKLEKDYDDATNEYEKVREKEVKEKNDAAIIQKLLDYEEQNQRLLKDEQYMSELRCKLKFRANDSSIETN